MKPGVFFIFIATIIVSAILINNAPSAISPEIAINPEKKCNGSLSEQFDCYESFYTNIVREAGVKPAMADLRRRYDENEVFVHPQCHQLAHTIGRAAMMNYSTVTEAYLEGDSFCWSGYYHGVLEGVAMSQGVVWLLSNIDGVCTEIPGKEFYSFDYYNCVHGLGHGFMSVSNHELFESLEMCGTLTGSWEQSSCWSGVFMENIISHGIKNYSAYLKPEDPLYPCNAVNDKYRQTCFLMQTSYMLEVAGRDFAKVFELCEESGIYSSTCYQSLGRDASGSTISDVSRTKSYCLLGKNDEQRSNCIIGAVKDFISYFHSDIEAKNLCASLSRQLRSTCSITVENYYKIF